ncbi:MAG TPA: HD domain-containing protein [Pseudonocardiaceae bacterium]|nr:HD domain-containing protein [Pseudonocardiaceae bacterium]
MTAVIPVVAGVRLAAVAGMFRELGDLKRVRVANAAGSVAQRSFVRGWAALVAGADPGRVAGAQCAAALAGTRLAGVDAAVLLAAGLQPGEVTQVLGRAVDEVAGGLHLTVAARAHAALAGLVAEATERPTCDQLRDVDGLPWFVGALCRQPRAGATAPGKPRLIVEPPENHAEHCWAVAVYGALLADDLGADPGEVLLLGLAHHLHNAVLPDAGFAGDTLLGEHLDAVQHRLTERELATLPVALAERVRALLELRADADTPVGRAFHAADVLDRVLQVHHHARAAGFTAEQALVDLELVHAGPVTDYQHAVLAAAGL